MPTPTASARCCRGTCAGAPAISRSSTPCWTPAPPTRSRRHEGGGMRNTFIGSPVERREDLRFVRGRGEYVDDLNPDGLLHAVIFRSGIAHGRIRAIDAAAALKIAGVHAVITAQDMPSGPPVIPMRLQPLPQFKPFEQPVIAAGKVRYVGEPIAVVLADSAAIGEDALEHIAVDIEPLPPVTGCAAAARGDRLLFSAAGTNRAMTFTAACGDADAAFAQ